MSIDLGQELEKRLAEAAARRSMSVEQLVASVLEAYLDSDEGELIEWVRATQAVLPRVWPAEDFSDWPRGVH